MRAEISAYPACLLVILLSLARQAQRDTETPQFILVRATLWCNILLQCGGGLPRGAEDELVQWTNNLVRRGLLELNELGGVSGI